MSKKGGRRRQMPKKRNVFAHSLQDNFFHRRIVNSNKEYDRNKLKQEDRKNLVDIEC